MPYATIVNAYNSFAGGAVASSITPSVDNSINLGSSLNRWASVFALALNAGASGLTISSNSLTQLTFSTSGGAPLVTSTGKYEFSGACGLGGTSNALAILYLGQANPLTGTRQWGTAAVHLGTSAATHASQAIIGHYAGCTTAAAAFTAPNLYQFYGDGTVAKGAGSTITNSVVYGGIVPTTGTNNAFIADNGTFSGSFFIHSTSTNPSLISGRLGFSGSSSSAVIFSSSAGILSGADQQGVDMAISATSSATSSIAAYRGQASTANAAFTCANLYQFYGANTTKGAASTITRHAIFGGASPTQGTNNAFITDTLNFATGTWGAYIATGSNYFGGPFIHGVQSIASAATITALSSANAVVRITGATGTSIQGIAAPTTGVTDGQIIRIYSTTAAVTLANENAGATAANRITTNTGADVVGTAPCAFTLVYDSASTRWILLASAT